MKKNLMWNIPLLLTYESVFQLIMTIFLFGLCPRKLVVSADKSPYTEIIGDFFVGQSSLMLLFLMAVSYRIMKVDKRVLENPVVYRTYGIVWEGLMIDLKTQLFYIWVHIVRRVIMCYVFLYMSTYNYFQIIFCLILNWLSMWYVGHFKPFAREFQFKELINEFFIL